MTDTKPCVDLFYAKVEAKGGELPKTHTMRDHVRQYIKDVERNGSNNDLANIIIYGSNYDYKKIIKEIISEFNKIDEICLEHML